MAHDIKFNVLVALVKTIQKKEPSSEKWDELRKFLQDSCEPADYFMVVRLIIPELDRARAIYGLTESDLARWLIKTLGVPEDSLNAVKLIHWRENGGNFAFLAEKLILQSGHERAASEITIKNLNNYLDDLASGRDKKTVLSTIMHATSTEELKWVFGIILKNSDSSWLMSLEDFQLIQEDCRFYTIGSFEVLSLLRKRESISLVAQFSVNITLCTDTSINLDVRLEKTAGTVYRSYVSKMFTVYDGDRKTFEIWVSHSPQAEPSDPVWTTLKTKRTKERFAAQKFSNDDDIMISVVLTQSVKTIIFSGPPELFQMQAFFIQNKVKREGFPHIVAVTAAELASHTEFQVRSWDQKMSNKITQGFFFTFCKTSVMQSLDRSVVDVKTFRLPSFFAEGVMRWYEEQEDIPKHICFVMDMVEKLSSASPGNRVQVQERYANMIHEKLEPVEILEALGSCAPYIEALGIDYFVEKACEELANFLAASEFEDLDTYVLEVLLSSR